jgi:signal transduction histidine kinase
VLTRRLGVRLLAPTLLVSLALLGACAWVVLQVNDLHLNTSHELNENLRSRKAAERLENTTNNLVNLLRNSASSRRVEALNEKHIEELNERARERLNAASDLANLAKEEELVSQIRQGLEDYFKLWNNRTGQPEQYAEMAEHLKNNVLTPSQELGTYNMGQVEDSDRKNLAIVENLRWNLLAIGLGGPVAGLFLGYAVARSLRHSIYQLSVRIRDAAGRLNRDLGSVTLEEEGDLPDLHRQMQGVTEEIERVIEQLQQREREVLRAEQLAAVGQVAAGVAHELRNPLTSVKMLVQTGLEGDKAAGLPSEDLAIIEHEVRRMEQCIRLFLDFARPPDSERRRTDLTEVVRRALALVEGRARRQKVQLNADLPEQPVLMKIDPEQIHQVLVNLLLNALDALPRGGTVHVHVRRAESRVEVRVADTGTGIATRVRDRLFEPFVSSKETGLGLGLSICKRLVEAHGGTIWGDNVREGGAAFTFTLPVEAEVRGPKSEVRSQRSEVRGPKSEVRS